jgi:hypothetical protein
MTDERQRAKKQLERFLQGAAEVERLFIEAYGLDAFRDLLRRCIDEDPGGIIRDSDDPGGVRRGLIKKLHQKMQ